jgi:hypothetical protein
MDYFAVQHLDVDRLLRDWRWLYPNLATLVARSVWGDLFLLGSNGQILWLDVQVGEFRTVAENIEMFRESVSNEELQEPWFATHDERKAAEDGLKPGPDECIAFAIPLVFAESGYRGNGYISDIYETVSFLGDLHRQIRALPDGSQVRLVIGKPPEKNPS